MKKVIFILLVITSITACDVFNKITETLNDPTPTAAEMADGLKSALTVGSENAVGLLGKENGFLDDNSVKIPFPQEIIKVKNTLDAAGFSNLTNKFVSELNRGASLAVKEALPIFKNAITAMTFEDAKNILLGERNAATTYFKTKTTKSLYNAFKPKVSTVLEKYGINTAYTKMMDAYNSIPFTEKMNTDLPDYVTNKAMDGLFKKITLEEAQIRDNIGSRVNDVLKKVFAYADSQKK
ncbi:MAG: DUF4197 domain-containing protein [Bacteroidales bacterium]|nr:DUF4197 domain-containing protein [Bacteroidales bacterium]